MILGTYGDRAKKVNKINRLDLAYALACTRIIIMLKRTHNILKLLHYFVTY